MKTTEIEPLVSVIMTAYNAGLFIDEALKSLINQTYKHLEIIVVDDGSTDNTWSRIKAYGKKDSRILTFRLKKNSGPSLASNYAIKKAKGKYIARLDADDIAVKDRIDKQVEFMEKNPEIIMLGGQCDIINENGSLIGEKRFPLTHDKIYEALFIMNPIQHPGSMYRSSTFKKAHIKYEKDYFISHDLKILFKLLPYGKFANLPDKTLLYRYRPNSITHKNPKRTFKETMNIRHWALIKGLYTPTFKNLIIHSTQTFLVLLLPNRFINYLFRIWRISRTKKVSQSLKLPIRFAYRFVLQTFLALIYLISVRQTK